MATLESDDANIHDAETINLRVVVYLIVGVMVLLVGGLGYYYHLQIQRDQLETQAREAFLLAKTPDEMVKVADQFPHTDQETLALLGAANASFAKRDFDAAIKDYQRIGNTAGADAAVRDSAQVGLASALEANGKGDDAINAYLVVAQRGDKSFYAPYAYYAVAQIYEQRGDKDNQRKTLNEATDLDPDSAFVKQAKAMLKELNASASQVQAPPAVIPATTVPVSAPAVKAVSIPTAPQK